MTHSPVEILLATWNGERFLQELLDSLAAQTFGDFRILARDDGSSDRTLEILHEWSAKHPGKLVLVREHDQKGGVVQNFSRLIDASSAPYVLFADQDDQWKPSKIEVTLEAMRAAEARHDAQTPLLVHTDLQVVDEHLREIHPSFWKYQNLRPGRGASFERLLVQNVVTGCTAMANRALLERGAPVPPDAVMHDWWLALAAAAFGQIVAVPQATIAYRQHGTNVLGARRWSPGHVMRKILQGTRSVELHESLRLARLQAKAFHDRMGADLDDSRCEALVAFIEMDRLSFWGKRRALVRHGLLKNGLVRNLGLLARV